MAVCEIKTAGSGSGKIPKECSDWEAGPGKVEGCVEQVTLNAARASNQTLMLTVFTERWQGLLSTGVRTQATSEKSVRALSLTVGELRLSSSATVTLCSSYRRWADLGTLNVGKGYHNC